MNETLPRCQKLDGSTLAIVPSYTEAGSNCEANCITVTDGERTAVYVPHVEQDKGDFGRKLAALLSKEIKGARADGEYAAMMIERLANALGMTIAAATHGDPLGMDKMHAGSDFYIVGAMAEHGRVMRALKNWGDKRNG